MNNQIINVLYIIWSLGLGGAERVVINLVKGLDKNRFNPIVCCLNDNGAFAEELEKIGIKVIALNKRAKIDLSVVPKLVKVIKENDIKIVHTHLWGANFWGRIAAKRAKVPVIIATEHNEDIWKSSLNFMLDRWLSKKTDKIIAVSEGVKKFYIQRGIPADKIEVIYNGINLSEYQQNESVNKKNIITLAIIGRLVPQKGHKYLFLALKKMLKQYKIETLVVGSGPMEQELRELSKSLGLDGSLIFTGLRSDIPNLLKMIDILVLPSLREGLSIIALEAMASAKPIVATNVGGNPELIIDKETGLLVEPENDKALGQALAQLISNKDLAKKLGENGRNRINKHFSLEKMVDETQRIYEEFIERKS